ncbi:hypothetical protein AB0940_30960 [Streptomyces sp. NPDC006656]|uniref:hypothetical protein n=1 Tax=Streptomyces sp. NPDC006656 TaxID=3156899 RepID=UPI003454ECE5
MVVDPDAGRSVTQALRPGKPVAALGAGTALLRAAGAEQPEWPAGVALEGADGAVDTGFWEYLADWSSSSTASRPAR